MDGGAEGSMKKYNPRFTTFTQVEAPCKDCPDRKLHCHEQCEIYQKYNEQMVMIRQRRLQAIKTNDAIYGAALNRNKSLMLKGRRRQGHSGSKKP